MNVSELCVNPDSIEAASFKHPLSGPRFQREFFSCLKLFSIFYFMSPSFPSYLTQTPVTITQRSVSSQEHTQTHLEKRQDMTAWPLCKPQIERRTQRQGDKEEWCRQAGWHSRVGLDQFFLRITTKYKKNFKRFHSFTQNYFTVFFSLFFQPVKTSVTKTEHQTHTQTHSDLKPKPTSNSWFETNCGRGA